MKESSKSNPWRSMTNKPLKWTLLVIATVAPMTLVLLWHHFQPRMPWNAGQVAPAPQDARTTQELLEDGRRVLESTDTELAKQEQFLDVDERVQQLVAAEKLDEAREFLDQQIVDAPANELLPKLYTRIAVANRQSGSAMMPEVTLIDPGMPPRQKIRFTPTVGEQQTIIMTIATSVTTTDDGSATTTEAIPTQRVTLHTTVKDINADGDITFDFIFTNIEVVDDAQTSSVISRKMINPLIGINGLQTVSNRGITQHAEFSIPPNIDPQLKKILDGMKDPINRTCSPMPSEAVGLGAKWKITEDSKSNGIAMVSTSTHEITKLEPDGFTMKIHVSQTAPAQGLKDPSLPAGMSLSLQSLKSEGEATTIIETNSMLQVKSAITLDSNSLMSIETGGQTQQFDVHTTTRIDVESKRE